MLQNKIKIRDTMYDVYTMDQYNEQAKSKSTLGPNVAILEKGYVYPVINGNPIPGPGVMVGSPVSFFRKPTTDEQKEMYSESAMIRFDNVTDIATMIDRLQAVKQLEGEMLTSTDNIFEPKIHPHDTPEMVALKTAVSKKHINLDKYGPRFGANYNNDKRLFNKPDISIKMMKRVARALDMNITLTISDAPDAPNPIGDVIQINLTDGISDDIEMEEGQE